MGGRWKDEANLVGERRAAAGAVGGDTRRDTKNAS